MKDFKPIILNCSCGSSEHMIIIRFDSKDKEAFVEVQLSSHKKFYKRILPAIKYILGYKCHYGHWDETLLNKKELKNLKNIITKFLRQHG